MPIDSRRAAAFFVLLLFVSPVGGTERVVFLDVGQGDAILVQSADCNLLVDAGNLATAGALPERLKSYGAAGLEKLVITHPHLDHFGGVFAFTPGFSIGQVYDNGAENADWVYFAEYKKWRERYSYSVLAAGDRLSCGNAEIEVLHPERGVARTVDLNEGSLVISVVLGEVRMLLAADVPASVERRLLEDEVYSRALNKIQVLKVSHHGSDAASSYQWLEFLDPAYGIISVGTNNRWQRPHESVLKRLQRTGVKVFRTDEAGDIICRASASDSAGQVVECESNGRSIHNIEG